MLNLFRITSYFLNLKSISYFSPLTLPAAYKFFCDKDLDNAHNAEADISATQEVLFAQLERYTDIGLDVNSIDKFCS